MLSKDRHIDSLKLDGAFENKYECRGQYQTEFEIREFIDSLEETMVNPVFY